MISPWRRALFVLALLALCAGLAVAQAPTVTAWQKKLPDRFFAFYKEGVKVDGDLRDWNLKDGVVALNADNSQLSPGPVRSLADSSAVVKFAWDRERLYVAASVLDQSLQPLVKTEDMPWSCDSLIFVVSTFGATKASDRYQQLKNVATSTEPFFGFSYYEGKVLPHKWTPGSTYVVKKTATGYDLEASLKLADIGYRPQTGDRLKMAFILSDLDADGKWSQLTRGFPAQIVSNPTGYWLDLRLRDATPWAGEIVTAQSRLLPGGQLQFMGDLDAFDGKPVLRQIQVRDAQGRALATVPAGLPLPVGATTIVAGTAAVGALPPGEYRLAASVENAGQTAAGAESAPFEILASVESERGAVGKLPDRYIVPDPYRVAFPSDRRGYTQQTIGSGAYLAMVIKVYEFEYASLYSKGRQASAGVHGLGYAPVPYALYKAMRDARYLEQCLGLAHGAYEAAKKGETTPFWIVNHKVINLLLAEPAVKEEDKAWLRDFFPTIVKSVWGSSKPQEWGAFNRALLWGGMLDLAAREMPTHPDVAKWKQYADLEWDSWWPYRDHDENSSDYNASSMNDYLDWAEFRNPEYLKDPGLARWLERYMLQVTPSGGMPGYGHASPWNASCYMWIPVFERMATITRDGRYKWAAHRLLEYANRQMDDLFTYHMVYDGAAVGCAWAFIYADESVAEAPPEMKSRLTERKQVLEVDAAFRKEMFDKYGITGLYYRLGDQMQPDKLLLRAGNDPFAPCGMLELCSNAGHHMSTVPNFNNFMHMRAVLLTDLGYFEKGPEYHNVIQIEDLTGIAPEAKSEVVTVPSLQVGSRCTYTQVQVENYKNWPVTNDRRVLFTDTGLVLVKDLVDFVEPFVCRVRQQWQTRNISPQSGPNWSNTNLNYLLMSGLGLGRGVQRWNNPNWDLLIYFTPQDGRDYEVFDRSLENPWQAVPLRLSQRYRGLPQKGQPLHFSTLLYPHRPVLEVAPYADRITVLKDTPDLTAFRVETDDNRVIFMGINDSGAKQELGDLVTDARVFFVEMRVDGTTSRASHLFVRGCNTLSVKGTALHTSQKRTDADKPL